MSCLKIGDGKSAFTFVALFLCIDYKELVLLADLIVSQSSSGVYNEDKLFKMALCVLSSRRKNICMCIICVNLMNQVDILNNNN